MIASGCFFFISKNCFISGVSTIFFSATTINFNNTKLIYFFLSAKSLTLYVSMDIAKTDIRLSVVVPFYNAERHIGDCVHSLMRQSLSGGIEFIFVNDSSTDASSIITRWGIVLMSAPLPVRAREITLTPRPQVARSARLSMSFGAAAALAFWIAMPTAERMAASRRAASARKLWRETP